MLPEVNTKEEKEDDKVLLAVTKEEATEIPREDVCVEQDAKDYKPSELSKVHVKLAIFETSKT